jgi:hypothetical protein
MEEDKGKIRRIKVVKVLAKAASDKNFMMKLRNDPKGTLNKEGIEGDEFFIPNEKVLKAILRILESTGDVIYKRR